jgi:hypothetical protein
LILEHLNRIENILQTTLPMQQSHLAMSAVSPVNSNGTHMSGDEFFSRTVGAGLHINTGAHLQHPASGLGTWTPHGGHTIMPKLHTTPALHLLQWPKIKALVSRPYNPQKLLQLEMNRPPLELSPGHLDLSNSGAYVQAFFERVNVWYACVNPYTWTQSYRTALSQGFRSGPESCTVLLVLALGAASTRGSISRIPADELPPGMAYFASAWALLPGIMARQTMASAQCMILAAAYLFYIVRPLEAWNLLSSASMKLQLLFQVQQGSGGVVGVSSELRELGERVYWNTLLFER